MANLQLVQAFTCRGIVAACLASAAHSAPATDPAVSPPSAATVAQNAAVLAAAPFSDRRDFDFAQRGFLGTRDDPLIKSASGRVVWDLAAFRFLGGAAPATVNPSLWRQAQLLAKAGLFKVTDHVYQVRGFDLANITFVRGTTGWIVIDPLTASETAKAAYDLVTAKLGQRPISAIIYTHSHVDHFAGAGGIATPAEVTARQIPVLAPAGFLAAAIGENVIAGPAMSRRAAYQFGVPLDKSATGTVSSGIGPALAVGTQTLIAPTREIDRTGEALTIDGVRMRFQLTPGTEAPAEMNVSFPDWNLVDLAENANATQHNILTPRGAQVRNAKAWADYLTASIELLGGADVLITSHGWPRFGADEIIDYLEKHRDAYAYLHDQTVRMMNEGYTGEAIGARLKLPKALEQEWYNRPYYGALSFNSRAVYQFYMGWYDGNPVHLAPRSPTDRGRRYVEAMGGKANVMTMAKAAAAAGDYAWASELLDKLVFADPAVGEARALLADCYDQLAWQSENSLWRNMYRTAATELRYVITPARDADTSTWANALPTTDLFNLLAVRLNAEKAGADRLTLGFIFSDRNEHVTVKIQNGVLIHRMAAPPATADAVLTARRADLIGALLGGVPLGKKIAAADATLIGDPSALQKLAYWLDNPAGRFPIIRP